MLPVTLSPRTFAAAVGVLAVVIAGFFLVFAPITVTHGGVMFNTETINCGTTVMPNEVYGGFAAADCKTAIGDRRAWGWPVAIGGGIVAAAALFVNVPARQSEREPEPED
jgi:hypothetical protein